MRNPFLQTTFLAVVACILWSTAFAGVKIGLQYTTPMHLAGIRFILAGLFILPFVGGFKSYFREIIKNPVIVINISLLQVVLQYSLFFFGINLVPSALAAIIIGGQPLFIALIVHFFMPNDKLNWRKLAIFLIGFSGIFVVSIGRNKFISASEIKGIGILLLIGVNIASAFSNILISRDGDKMRPLALSSSTMIFGGFILYILSLIFEGPQAFAKPLPYYGALLWLSFLSATAVSIWVVLLKRPGVKVTDLNFWKFLIPLAGVILSWIILTDEKPSFIPILGMAVITLSLVMLNINKRRNNPLR